MTLYEEILQMYPLVSYQENRQENGHVELVEESEYRILAEGAFFRKCRYRRGAEGSGRQLCCSQ